MFLSPTSVCQQPVQGVMGFYVCQIWILQWSKQLQRNCSSVMSAKLKIIWLLLEVSTLEWVLQLLKNNIERGNHLQC